jgi:hypothetical protein
MTMRPASGVSSVPRILVAGVVVLAASALFGWGYVVGRQGALGERARPGAAASTPLPSLPNAEIEARKADLDREMARLVETQKEAVRLRTLFENEKARVSEERRHLAAWRPTPAEIQASVALHASVNGLLAKAADRLSAADYDGAVGLYDEALRLDVSNVAAQTGRAGALSAKAIVNATARGGRAPTRTFHAGATEAAGAEGPAAPLPDGFEPSPGVAVKQGSIGPELPGKIKFELVPAEPRTGEPYNVKVSFLNEGQAPIGIASVLSTTVINGKKLQGPVPPLTRSVAPHQTAPVFETSDHWKDETTSWSMEVTLRTTAHETYRNSLTWK